MSICRKLCRSWYTLSLTVLLSILVILRRDLKDAQGRLEMVVSKSIFKDDSFYDFVATKDIKSVLSQNGRYMIYPKVFAAELKFHPSDVTIATHCSYYNLRYLPNMVNSWRGPISVSIFTSNPTKVWLLMKLFRKCSMKIRYFVDFHVVVPFFGLKYTKIDDLRHAEPNILNLLQHLDVKFHKNMVCYNLDALMDSFHDIEKNYELNDFLEYPNNMLRNVAWENSKTNFVTNIDIDLLTSDGAHEMLKSFLRIARKQSRKKAFVVPVFEIDDGYYSQHKKTFPVSKPELLKLIRNKVTRPFYSEVCPRCQACTRYADWYECGYDDDELGIVNYDYHLKAPCEPFMILPATAPKFDERFYQYGYNRMSHVCEVLTSGFEFKILDNVFLTHLGFKESKFHGSKNDEQAENEVLFHAFNQELREKYPESVNFCT